MFMTIAIGLAAALAALLLYAASKPGACQFARSIRIAAPPERIFPLIDDLRAMNAWNPFVKVDPNIKLAYSGPARGVGAVNTFEGNGKVGSGQAEIVESIAPTKLVMALQMDRPMKCRNRVEFTLAPQPNGADVATDVTWTMSGPQPFIGKLMSIFISMDKMVGGAFEAGLADLKSRAEA
ncbi:SRPBCC family protein [Methylocapsa aurea]|uniref:SRPBCC family protein n=1 Tax=Methylocapsa aurea TaxID=663610 RepID=UPI0005613527|nr:SRPBCC family protein [Methylocapsa aurea]